MQGEDRTLVGRHVRLEPLGEHHVEGLAAAAAADPSLYRWSTVPQGTDEVLAYVRTALAWKADGAAVPYATVRLVDGAVVGSTRFCTIERWEWPEGHPLHGRPTPDACEIGYTWLTRSAIRTGANTDAKLLMLTLAFEEWEVHRVCLHTDVRNERSRAAIERLGARFEGVLRAHRLAADLTVRESARFSIVAEEWSEVKRRLTGLLG